MKKLIKHIIGYCRKSTDTEDKQIRSLEDQKREIRQCYEKLPADLRAFPLLILEESRSGYHAGKREQFNLMLQMADQGEIAGIIVLDPTRISRNHEDTGRFVQRIAEGKIPFLMTVDGKRYDRSDTGTVFMLTLENTMSWKDSADKSKRVKLTMKQLAVEGRPTGQPPLGYKNIGEHGSRTMIVDPDTAPGVLRIFQLYSTGAYSMSDLIEEAKKLGLRSRPNKNNREGKLLETTSIAQMIANPHYIGTKRYDGKEFPNQHEAIVPLDVWLRCQRIKEGRRVNTSRTKELTKRELYVALGCIKCGVCKTCTLSPYTAKGKYVYYECKNKRRKCKNCMKQEVLLEQLHDRLSLLVVEPDEMAYMRTVMRDEHEKRIKQDQKRQKSLQGDYAAIQTKIASVFSRREEAKQLGILDAVDIELQELKKRRDELKQALDSVHHQSNDWVDHVIQCFELAKLAQEAIKYGSPETRQAVLKSLSSNYYVKDGKLVCDWVSPFSERAKNPTCINWLLRLDSNQ